VPSRFTVRRPLNFRVGKINLGQNVEEPLCAFQSDASRSHCEANPRKRSRCSGITARSASFLQFSACLRHSLGSPGIAPFLRFAGGSTTIVSQPPGPTDNLTPMMEIV
jgi:hypothetical protein